MAMLNNQMVFFSDFAGWLFGMLLEIGLLQIQLIVVTTVTELGWMKQKKIGWYPALLFVGLYFL